MKAIHESKLSLYWERINGDRRPITAQFSVSDICNASCSYCEFGFKVREVGRTRAGLFMSFPDFRKYVKILQGHGVLSIIFTGTGEPAMNEDFIEMCDWLWHEEIPFGVNSNMLRLAPVPANWLKVGLDAWDAESYMAKKGVDGYGKVLRNVRRFSELCPETKIGLQAVIEKEGDATKFVKAMTGVRVPHTYISLRPVEMVGTWYTGSEGRDAEKIKREILTLQNEYPAVQYSYKWDYVNTKVVRCTGHWTNISVDHAGKVPYCCNKWSEVVGKITDRDILERLEQHRTSRLDCWVPCRGTGLNHFLQENDLPFDDPKFI